jgi:hypothetical protein
MALIDQFQDDPETFVFLISTMAGGTGLNLTAANKVVIFGKSHCHAHTRIPSKITSSDPSWSMFSGYLFYVDTNNFNRSCS